jgi:uncharacterized damage-inducible protein DinB
MSAVENLIAAYVQGPADLRAAVKGLSKEQIAARPVAGRMSTLEVLCHLADFEPIMADRMKRVIALGGTPLILAADENLFLKELRYDDRDAEEELTLIEVTRKQMARILRTLKPEDFQKTGVHTERGLLTLERLLQLAVNHIVHHLTFIVEKRKALGVK